MNGGIAAIITCHNLGHTLREALDSVLQQTRPAGETLIIDDRSTDAHTLELVAQLGHEGFRIVQGDGKGVCAARNLGAALTDADYLMWLDADDVLDPRYFEIAAGRLDADTALDFVSCALRAFGAASYTWRPSPPTFVDAISTGGVPHASTLIRRKVWEATGGFDESIPSFELLDFWATVIERGFRGVVLEQPLLNYRIREGSGYRRSIQEGTYQARLAHFYAKHRTAVEAHGLELIKAKDAFFISQRNYWQSLEKRAADLERELADLDARIAESNVRQAPATSAGRGRVEPGGAAILAYHRIASLSPDSHNLCVPPHDFRAQMTYLREHCTPMPLAELAAAAAAGNLPPRAVAVTFDDGYVDALTVASPILSELGVPATFFVNSDRLDEPHERWWDLFERLFEGDQLDDWNQRAWPLDEEGRRSLIAEALTRTDVQRHPRPTHRVLTASELRALADRPAHAMGGHTINHVALPLQSDQTKRREVSADKAALEELLQRPVTSFSYPYGDFDEATVRIVREAGYETGVTVQPGAVTSGTHSLLLPRFEIVRADRDRFAQKLEGIFGRQTS
jgi:peptidoglycan/xylan/chitin deacetylase (PgdA/CDA1 family)/glycosyltransferase involved in cell wall biosynthesis